MELIQNNQIDFLSVASHEIGHALGPTSGIDDADWLATLTRRGGDAESSDSF